MPTLRLPLVRCGRLDGDVGAGPSAPSVAPIPDGVIVNQRGRVSRWSADLTTLGWSQPVTGWGSGPFVLDAKALVGPVAGRVLGFAVESGRLIDEVPYAGIGGLQGADARGLVVRGGGFVTALAWDGTVRWRRETLAGIVRLSGDSVLLTERFDTALVCCDIETGQERWTFVPPPEGDGETRRLSQVMAPGFPSVTIVGDRVIVLTSTATVFILSLLTGELRARATPPFAGCYVVTDRRIFFKQAFGLSEFDHERLQEVDRIEYRDAIEPLYHGRAPSVNAFGVGSESVVWTTMEGVLLGVSRKVGRAGKRSAWREEIPGAVMPIGDAPVIHGDKLYVTVKGEKPELLCYESAP